MGPTRKHLFKGLAIAVFVLLAVVALWLRGCMDESDISYFERESGIHFPSGCSEVETAHPREFCLSGRLRIPKSEEAVFLKRYDFCLSTDFPLNADLGIDGTKFASREKLRGLYRSVGRSPTNRWELAYNPDEQSLFFVILYPDMSGDPPS